MSKYKVILVDCPWKYFNERDNRSDMGGVPYSTMTQEALKGLPIKDIADEDCLLFMWAVLPKLPEAFEVMKSWGFKYVSSPFVWIKLNPNGSIWRHTESHSVLDADNGESGTVISPKDVVLKGGVYSGMGSYTAGNAEIVLMGKIGKPKRIDKSIKQVIVAPRGRHSRKPAETRDRIKQLMGDVPAIEIFATEVVDGWDSIGNAVDGLDITESLQRVIDK